MLHREKATDLRNVDALSDKAVVLFERGDQRSAFVYFDLCVSARPFEARYRLSRAICAYALQMYLLTYEDARRAYQIKSTEQVDHSYIAVQEELSEKLRLSLQQADKRILARSNYWMAKACLELGQIEEAEAYFTESQLYMGSEKGREMVIRCQNIKKEGLVALHRNTARNRMMVVFCDLHASIDNTPFRQTGSASLQHPDAQMPETVTGAFGVFMYDRYHAEKDRILHSALARERQVYGP